MRISDWSSDVCSSDLPMKNRGLLRSLLDRALALQSQVLLFTVDWPIPSQNHRNIRNRLGQHTARGLVQVLSRPRWAVSMATSGRKFEPGNFAGRGFDNPPVLQLGRSHVLLPVT